ncbi:phosphoketolase family protein [Rhizobium binxianense]
MLTFGCGASSKGAATTSFGMMVHNEPDRFHLAIKAIERMPGLKERHPT